MLHAARLSGIRNFASTELSALLGVGALQLGIQVLGFAAGIAAIWLLPKSEFAYYTVANAMLGTLTVLTDCGVTQGVMAHGGRSWQDGAALSRVFASGNSVRRRLALLSTVGSLPILYMLLRQSGADTTSALITSLAIVPLFLSVLSGQFLEVVLKLHQQLRSLQWVQLRGAALRLLLVFATLAVFPVAWLGILAAGLAQAWTAWRTRRLVAPIIDLEAEPDTTATHEIVRQVRRMAPSAVYYAFSAQLNVWLISVFGETEAVAEVGALARLAMVFAIASAIISLRYVPRFARMNSKNPHRTLKAYWAAQAGLIAAATGVCALVALFASPVLALLGPGYASLTHEVVLAVAGGAVTVLAGSAYSLAAARGVVLTPLVVVPSAVAIQALLVFVLPISTVAGVLWLGLLSNAAFWLIHAVNFSYATSRHAPAT